MYFSFLGIVFERSLCVPLPPLTFWCACATGLRGALIFGSFFFLASLVTEFARILSLFLRRTPPNGPDTEATAPALVPPADALSSV